MTITARVHNRTIALPPEVEVEEGAEVQVIVPKAAPRPQANAAPSPAWLRRAVGAATSGLSTEEILRASRGED
jgi:hypothetical protein